MEAKSHRRIVIDLRQCVFYCRTKKLSTLVWSWHECFFLIPNIKIASLKIQKPSGNELLAIFEMVILGADFSAENLHHQSAPNRFRLPRRSSPEKIASEAMAKLREAKLRIWKSRGSHVQNHHTLGMMIQIMMKSWEPWIHDEEVAPLPPEGEKFPVIALDYQHRRSASALFL